MVQARSAFAEIVSGEPTPADRLVSALIELSNAEGGVAELSPMLAELACMVAGADGASISLVEGTETVYIAATGSLTGCVGGRVPREGSLTGVVLATAQPQVSEDTTRDTRVNQVACVRYGVASMAVVPIRHGGKMIAALTIVSGRPHQITDQRVRLVQPLIQAASARFAQAEAAETAVSRLGVLTEMADAVRQVLIAEDPGQTLVEAVARILGAPNVYLFVPDHADGLVVSRSVGAPVPELTLPRDMTSFSGATFVTGRPHIVADWTKSPSVSASLVERVANSGTADARAAVYIPLGTPDGPAGVLGVTLREPLTANNADLLGALVNLAAETGIAITRDDLRRSLADQARTDPLTGQANRRVWAERLDIEVVRAQRTGEPLAICVLDLDHFKIYNDTFGHPAGDELLRAVTAAWVAVLRPTDLLARIGGEEFGVLLAEADLRAGTAVMQRLRSVMPAGQTVSIGVTVHRGDEGPSVTMHRADQAMYAAKAAGRDQVVSQ